MFASIPKSHQSTPTHAHAIKQRELSRGHALFLWYILHDDLIPMIPKRALDFPAPIFLAAFGFLHLVLLPRLPPLRGARLAGLRREQRGCDVADAGDGRAGRDELDDLGEGGRVGRGRGALLVLDGGGGGGGGFLGVARGWRRLGLGGGFGGEVGLVGVEVDGDGLLAREVEALGAQGQLLDLHGRAGAPEDCGQAALGRELAGVRLKRFGGLAGLEERGMLMGINH
jgi:hypothetical protein